MEVIRERILQKIRPFYQTFDLIKVLTGIRRGGKSVVLKQIQKELKQRGVRDEQILFYNFEDGKNENLLQYKSLYEDVMSKVNSGGPYYLFFDEIQWVVEWEKAINALRTQNNLDIYITGSNAKLLSSELSTLLSGRTVNFEVLPFSYGEFLECSSLEDSPVTFRQYLELGSLPFIH